MKNNRFEVVYKQGTEFNYKGVIQILVDKETGVNYLSQYNVGLTPLLDRDGKPIVTPIINE